MADLFKMYDLHFPNCFYEFNIFELKFYEKY